MNKIILLSLILLSSCTAFRPFSTTKTTYTESGTYITAICDKDTSYCYSDISSMCKKFELILLKSEIKKYEYQSLETCGTQYNKNCLIARDYTKPKHYYEKHVDTYTQFWMRGRCINE
jgi:hypothetical protein